MSLQITKGKLAGAVRAIISGTEGIGKSTLATKIPDSLVVDIEDGSRQIDCNRVIAPDWRAIEFVIDELIKDNQGYKAVIFDTADWLERALIEWMLRRDNQKSIEAYGYGKGYTMLQEHFARFLAKCDKLIAAGIHVVFVAHTKVTRVSPPDQTDGYDRYELKLTKQVSPLLKEWSELYLFANYKVQIVEGTDGKLKAQGGKERVMYANRTAAYDAKNRFGLADEMPMEFAQIAQVFTGAAPRVTETVATQPKLAAPVKDEQHGTPPAFATAEQLSRLEELKKTPSGAAEIEAWLEHINGVDCSEFTTEQAAQLISEIEANAKIAQGATTLPQNIQAWLAANEKAVNEYLVHVKWLTVGQTWRDLTEDKVHSIVDKADKFARAAKIPALGKAA